MEEKTNKNLNEMSISHAMHGWSYANWAEYQCFVLDTALLPVKPAEIFQSGSSDAGAVDVIHCGVADAGTCELMAAYSSNEHISCLCKELQVVQEYPNFWFSVCVYHTSPDLLSFATKAAVIDGSVNHGNKELWFTTL